jgi:hypothetical protein
MLQRRSNFIKSVDVDGIKEKDFLLSSFSRFTWSRPMLTYNLTYDDYMRPEMLSYRLYGVTDYWWIILKCNPGFDDIYNDFAYDETSENNYPDALQIDSIINIPHPQDIKDFIVFAKGFIEEAI